MSWGKTPPWVYKKQVKDSQDNSQRIQKDMKNVTEKLMELMAQKLEIQKEIAKYTYLQSGEEIPPDKLESIIQNIRDIVMDDSDHKEQQS